MQIEIIVGSWISRHVSEKSPIQFTCEEGITPSSILDTLTIPEEEVGLITYNQKAISSDTPLLVDGQLRFYPTILGG